MSLFNPLYQAVAQIVLWLHTALSFLGPDWSWALAIVALTVLMRILIFPLFVKQVRSQRQMQLLAPKMQEIRKKYSDDRQKQNEETMKLYQETGVNPFLGCLPILVQMPIFFALFRVLNHIQPDKQGVFKAGYGLSVDQTREAATAKIFGTPLAAALKSPAYILQNLHATHATVVAVNGVLIALMMVTSFMTSRQLIKRNSKQQATQLEGSQLMQQRIMLYGLPLFFAVSGFAFPLGVLLYWLTTNLWTLGQQFFVIRKMDENDAKGVTRQPKKRGAFLKMIEAAQSQAQGQPSANGTARSSTLVAETEEDASKPGPSGDGAAASTASTSGKTPPAKPKSGAQRQGGARTGQKRSPKNRPGGRR